MAKIMLTGMLIMALASWMYAIAAAFSRVRLIILEREQNSAWAQELMEQSR